jgi:hypothetical protein
VSEHVSAFWDVLPTFCDVAGANIPEETDGISFLPALVGETQPTHAFLYWEFPGYGGQQAVRLGDYKALRTNLWKNPSAPTQLYDLKTDVGETTDIADEHPEIVERAKKIMQREHVDSELFPFPEPQPHESMGQSDLPAIPKDAWSLVRVSSESAFNGKTGDKAFDNDAGTWWHTEWRDDTPSHPHEIVIDLGATHDIAGLRYLPRQDGGTNGTITRYEIFIGSDPDDFGDPVAAGSFAANTMEKEVTFDGASGRYVKLRSLAAMQGQPFASAAEFTLLGE